MGNKNVVGCSNVAICSENKNDVIPISEIYEIQPYLDLQRNEGSLGIRIDCIKKNTDIKTCFTFICTKWDKYEILLIVKRFNQLIKDKVETYKFSQVCDDIGLYWSEESITTT